MKGQMKDAVIIYLKNDELCWSHIYPGHNFEKYLIVRFNGNDILICCDWNFLAIVKTFQTNFMTLEAMKYLKGL